MKRVIEFCIAASILLSFAGCRTASVNIEELKEKYPAYFEMSDFKGIEVYVWQIAENSYRCGMMSGTNRMKTQEEIWALQDTSLSIEEAKAILAEMGVATEEIFVIPITQTSSGYPHALDDDFTEKVTQLFE